MFSDAAADARASAMIYLMFTYRACNVEPYAYLIQALGKLPQRVLDIDVTGLLPFDF